MRRALLATIVLVPVCLTCGACGGTGRTSSVAKRTVTIQSANAQTNLSPLERDEDDDDANGEEVGRNPHDPDADGDDDNLKPRGYYDPDDSSLSNYGHAADATEKRELTAFFRRYYTAAVAADGVAVCPMLTAALAKSVPGVFAGSYPHAAATCPALLTKLLAQHGSKLSASVEVIRVRALGDRALVLFGATDTPASYIGMQRESGGWRVVSLIPSALN